MDFYIYLCMYIIVQQEHTVTVYHLLVTVIIVIINFMYLPMNIFSFVLFILYIKQDLRSFVSLP